LEVLGARFDDGGRLYIDDHQQTSVPGLYAAGDLARGPNRTAPRTVRRPSPPPRSMTSPGRQPPH